MKRCLELASLGQYHTAPNPMVGAVLVYNQQIIGEGFHAYWGGKHAEVNCFESVQLKDQNKIKQATLYVSLEPCTHYGKTPPCVDLVLQNRVPRVVIASYDCNKVVCGKGIEKLRKEGVEVIVGILDQQQKELNKMFYRYHEKNRPYITLKWAESADGFISRNGERVKITTANQDMAVHKLRAIHQAILVGKKTAEIDDPILDTRLWIKKDLIRVVLDSHLTLDRSLQLFRNTGKLIVLNLKVNKVEDNIHFIQLKEMLVAQIIEALYRENIISVLVEGGAQTLQSFIDAGLYDEITTFKGNIFIKEGVKAPSLK